MQLPIESGWIIVTITVTITIDCANWRRVQLDRVLMIDEGWLDEGNYSNNRDNDDGESERDPV